MTFTRTGEWWVVENFEDKLSHFDRHGQRDRRTTATANSGVHR